MRIFLGTPITSIVGKDKETKGNYEAIKRIIDDIRRDNHEVFCAIEKEQFGRISVTDEECTERDYKKMQEYDIYITFPNDSYGCAVELGWATAMSKPVFIAINKRFGTKSPLYKGLKFLGSNVIVNEYDSKSDFPVDESWTIMRQSIRKFIDYIRENGE